MSMLISPATPVGSTPRLKRRSRPSPTSSMSNLMDGLKSRGPSISGVSEPMISRAASEQLVRPASLFPTNVQELFQPLVSAKNLPEHAQSYIALLSESTTSQGSMQKHLLKLACRGAATAAKLSGFIQNPLDAALDNVMESGSELLLKKLAHLQPDAGTEDRPREKKAGWKLLRHAVLGVSCFKSSDASTRTQDDSCLSGRGDLHPAHTKILCLMLSMMASGPASAMADALPQPPPSPWMNSDVVVSVTHAIGEVKSHTAQFSSMRQAPSLRAHPSGSTDFICTGGMAASTAMKLLNSDSKRNLVPGLEDVMTTILDSVGDSMDEPAHVSKPADRGNANKEKLGVVSAAPA